MLLDKEVCIKWNNATKKWYEEKGYVHTYNGNSFIIDINDMIKTSTVKVNVKCDYCGKEHTKEYRKYILGRQVIEKDCCSSKKCLAKKTKEINMNLYGVESCMQRNDIKNKVSESMRTSFEEVLLLCKKKGLTLLSNESEYKNDRSRIRIICNNHIDRGIQDTNFANIKKNKSCCFYGGSEETANKKRLDFSVVKNKFLELGLIPLFNEKDYKGNYSNLKFICPKHKGNGEQYTKYAMIQQGSYGCNYCSKEYASKKLRLDEEYVFNTFKEKGLTVLQGEKYKGKDHIIRYTCDKHPDIIQYSSYGNLKVVKQPCDMCRNEESISRLNKRLRSSITSWKKNTELFYNEKCMFTNSSIYDVHHIYPFNEIIKESLLNLNLNADTTNGEDIEKIKKEVVRLHEVYGIGACMHPDIHNLFHVKYGKNCTSEDFYVFKKDYINGLYDKEIDNIEIS